MRFEVEISKSTMARVIVVGLVTAATLAIASPIGDVPNAFQAGNPISASQVNENFQSLANDIATTHAALVPIGSIVAWHKALVGASAPPAGWVECNGQVLSDPASTLDGQTIPDLNGESLFLRGGLSAGQVQDEDVSVDGLFVDMAHSHSLSTSHVSANRDGGGNFSGSSNTGIPAFQSASYWNTLPLAGSDHTHTVGSYSGQHSVQGGGTETRPKNMSVVWIMRVR